MPTKEHAIRAPSPARFPPESRFARAREMLRRPRYVSLRWNAGIALAAFCLAGAIWFAALERVRYEEADAVGDAVTQNSNLARALEEQTVRTLKGVDQALRYLRHEYGVHGSQFDIRQLIDTGVIDNALFHFVGLIDTRGEVIAGSRNFSPANLADRDFFIAQREGGSDEMFIGKPVLGEIAGDWIIPMSHRLEGPDGSFRGVVFAGVDPDYFTAFYSESELGADGLVTLVGEDGVTRARRAGDARSVGQDMNGSTLMAEQAKRPIGSFVSIGKIEGVSRFFSYRSLARYPLIVAVGTSRAEALAEFHQRERNYYAGAALASAFVLLSAAGMIFALSRQRRSARALAESEARFKQMAESIRDVFFLIDADNSRMHYVSPAYEEIWGRSRESLYAEPRSWANAIHPDDRARALEKSAEGMGTGGFDFEYRIVRPDASVRWIRVRGYPIRDASGAVYRTAGIAQDVTEQHHMQERLAHQAHHDALTGLPNRVLCFDRLRQTLSLAQRHKWTASFLFVDLDRFKGVNDTLGHAAGDQLLRRAAARISRSVRAEDTVARLGGDEFAVILSDLAQASDAIPVARKILDGMARPFSLEGNELFLTASIGIASYPSDGADPEALVKNADAAMFQAKLMGRNTYQFYTPAMNERALEKLTLETQLRRAIEREEFLLHFQPKLDLASGALTGFEALLRWKLPENGLVPPSDFVPLLEDTGLILPVGEWVLRAACDQIRAWRDAGFEAVPVAVNLSARQFQRADIRSTVTEALRRSGVDPQLLELEITESAAMQKAEETVATLRGLKALGVRLSIDDFGTGYSSLAYLKQFPLDSLKIDRSFVTGLPEDTDNASISRAVIGMAHSLNMKVIAEGVETEAQRVFLAASGCDQMQGFLASRPVPAAECLRFLRRHRRGRAEGGSPRRLSAAA